jgi:hypothetical protein
VVIEKGVYGFFFVKGASADVLVGAEGAVFTVVGADVGDEGFEEDAGAAIGEGDGINPVTLSPSPAALVVFASAGACQIVLCVGAEYFQLLLSIRDAYYGGHRTPSLAYFTRYLTIFFQLSA